MSWTGKLLSYLNLFLFRTWAWGELLALSGVAWDCKCLTMIPLVVLFIGLVYSLHILPFSNKIVCCGIFGWVTQTLNIWSIYFSISSLKLISSLSLVMCVFEPNIGSLSLHNHINQPKRLPLFIVMFGVHPRSPPPLENSGFWLLLMIIPVFLGLSYHR